MDRGELSFYRRDSMQLTSKNRFTRSLSGGYKMTNGNHVRIFTSYSLRTIKESVVRESTELAVDERVEDGAGINGNAK